MVRQSEVESEFQAMTERRREESPKKIKRDSDNQADNTILKYPFAGDDMRSVLPVYCQFADISDSSVGRRDPEAECSRLRIESNEVCHLDSYKILRRFV